MRSLVRTGPNDDVPVELGLAEDVIVLRLGGPAGTVVSLHPLHARRLGEELQHLADLPGNWMDISD